MYPPLPTGVMPQPPSSQDCFRGGVGHRRNRILSNQEKANSSAKVCHTLVDKVVSEAVRLANKEQRKRITTCKGIVAALVNGAMSKSERLARSRTGFCRIMVKVAVNNAVARSETKSVPSKKRKFGVMEGNKNEVEQDQNQTSRKRSRRIDVSVAREVIELSVENSRNEEAKYNVANESAPEFVNNRSFKSISNNSNSKKVANKEQRGPHFQRGKFKTGRKRKSLQKNLITQYFMHASRQDNNHSKPELDINLGGGETAAGGGGVVGGKQNAGKTGGGDQHRQD